MSKILIKLKCHRIVNCFKHYPPDSVFFQLLQKGIKSSDTKNIDLASDRK